jgi:hypothetical protein
MDNQFLMDMVYVGCGVIFGLIVRKFIVTYCKRPWVGLTDEERTFLAWESNNGPECVAMTEAKLKEKNT